MSQFLNDIDEVSRTVAIIGGVVAAGVAVWQLKANNEQRKAELRWRQANAAREIINDIHSNDWARNAVAMLDWSERRRSFKLGDNVSAELSYVEDVIPALTKSQSAVSPTEQDIVYCFDWFFYFINRIEHYIRTNLIAPEDVEDILMLYRGKIKRHESEFNAFMISRSYNLATAFWDRRSGSIE
jgi:hypothetical protein